MSHVDWETLVDYWAGELADGDTDAVDEHLMGCAECSAASGRVAAITEALRAEIPPLVAPERVAELRARGLVVVENPMRPGERREALFAPGVDVLLHTLAVELAGATRVDFRLTEERTGRVLLELDDVPVDRERGAVLIACQRHFDVFPHDTVAELRTHGPAPAVHRYTILHRFA